MDTQRLILFLVFSFSLMFLWEAYQKQVNPPAPVPAKTSPAAPQKPADVPTVTPPASPPSTAAPGVPPAAPGTAAVQGEQVTVRTDLYTATIDSIGGVVSEVALARHRDATDPKKPYKVIQRGDAVSIAQAGLLGEGLPNHRTPYRILPGPRELQPGQNTLQVKLEATAANGNPVVQTLTLHRGSYVIDVGFEIRNATGQPQTPFAYFQLARDTKTALPQSSWTPVAYTGPVVYNEVDKFKKVEFGEIDKLAADPKRKAPFTAKADNGWVAMIEHYFVNAWLPPAGSTIEREFYVRKLDGGLYAAGLIVPLPAIQPGATGTTSMRLYAGPQEQDVIGQLAPGFDLVVDYGIFTVLAAPLFWLLKWLHGLIGNWGWAIVVMTIIIKMAFYPLNAAAARSMAKMKIVGPKLKALQEQYANDKQQLQMRMMELYKQEKINPLGGCLPILVQIPVFIALYWVLLSAVELRYAPWIGYIKDLSAPDPYFVLPVVYAITAYLQVKLSPTPITDPVQARVMQIMPVAFSVLFIFFPSGLVLYWLVNNILQIAQQWHVNRMLEKEAALAAAKRR